MTSEQYARLKSEAAAPYRGLRKFIYIAFGASGFIGGLIFLSQLAAGGDKSSLLPNLAIQVGVVALMIWLFRLEEKAEAAKRSPVNKRNT
jgi:hypothetical protein